MNTIIQNILKLNVFEHILNDLNDSQYYKSLENNIIDNIDGRICHHRIRILHTIFKLNDFNSYLEIGVHNGSSMSYVVSNDKKINCYGIDLFEDTWGGYKTVDKINLPRTKSNIEKNNKCSNIELIKGNSFSSDTITKIKSVLKDKVDVLFIDGDHSYTGVKNDFLNYSNLVKSNGLIILDDFDVAIPKRYPGILKFVCEHIYNNPDYKILGVYASNELLILKK